jgi:hypothetical protein
MPFPLQQLGDQEGAQQEEHGDAVDADLRERVEPGVLRLVDRREVGAVRREDEQERDEAQHVQFGAVVPGRLPRIPRAGPMVVA